MAEFLISDEELLDKENSLQLGRINTRLSDDFQYGMSYAFIQTHVVINGLPMRWFV